MNGWPLNVLQTYYKIPLRLDNKNAILLNAFIKNLDDFYFRNLFQFSLAKILGWNISIQQCVK